MSLRDVSPWVKSLLPSLHRAAVLGPLAAVPEARATHGLLLYKARHGTIALYDSRAHEPWFNLLCGAAGVEELTPSGARTGDFFAVVQQQGVLYGQQHMQHMHLETTRLQTAADVCSSLTE